MLHSADAEFFMSNEHLEGVAKQIEKSLRRILAYFIVSVVLALLILLSQSNIDLDIKTPIAQIADVQITKDVMLLILSVTSVLFSVNFLNHYLLSNQAGEIFQRLGFSPMSAYSRASYRMSRWSSESLWIDVLAPRVDGIKSGLVHYVFLIFAYFILFFLFASYLAVIVWAAFVGLMASHEVGGIGFWVVALPSFLAVVFSLVGLLVSIAIPMKFKLIVSKEKLDIDE